MTSMIGRYSGRPSPAKLVWTLVCAGWVIVTFAWRDSYLAMMVDDAFYYFETAQNLSHGLGSSFDGINPTNGYHPLWLITLAAFSTLAPHDPVAFCRLVLVLQISVVWVGGLVLTRLPAPAARLVLWPLSLVLLHPYGAKVLFCGQESALVFALSSVALLFGFRTSPGRRPLTVTSWMPVCLVCVLVTLARLDMVFYSALVLSRPLMLPTDSERDMGLARRAWLTSVGLAVLCLGLLAYVSYSRMAFGHWLPVSAVIRLEENGSHGLAPARWLGALSAVLVSVALWRVVRRSRDPGLALLVPPVGACLILSVVQFGILGAGAHTLARLWYLEPYLFAACLAAGQLLFSSHLRGVLVGALAATWLAFSVFAWRYRLQPRSYALYGAGERCGRWLERHAAPGAVSAAWNAGFVAWFTEKPVMNLDGLINSWDFKERYLDRGRVDDFLWKRHSVDYVVEYAWPGMLTGIAERFRGQPPPTRPQPRTTTTGSTYSRALRRDWGVDLAPFSVAHVECVAASVIAQPFVTREPVYYFVLAREPCPGCPTLAEFALAHQARTSCQGLSLGC